MTSKPFIMLMCPTLSRRGWNVNQLSTEGFTDPFLLKWRSCCVKYNSDPAGGQSLGPWSGIWRPDDWKFCMSSNINFGLKLCVGLVSGVGNAPLWALLLSETLIQPACRLQLLETSWIKINLGQGFHGICICIFKKSGKHIRCIVPYYGFFLSTIHKGEISSVCLDPVLGKHWTWMNNTVTIWNIVCQKWRPSILKIIFWYNIGQSTFCTLQNYLALIIK